MTVNTSTRNPKAIQLRKSEIETGQDVRLWQSGDVEGVVKSFDLLNLTETAYDTELPMTLWDEEAPKWLLSEDVS